MTAATKLEFINPSYYRGLVFEERARNVSWRVAARPERNRSPRRIRGAHRAVWMRQVHHPAPRVGHALALGRRRPRERRACWQAAPETGAHPETWACSPGRPSSRTPRSASPSARCPKEARRSQHAKNALSQVGRLRARVPQRAFGRHAPAPGPGPRACHGCRPAAHGRAALGNRRPAARIAARHAARAVAAPSSHANARHAQHRRSRLPGKAHPRVQRPPWHGHSRHRQSLHGDARMARYARVR